MAKKPFNLINWFNEQINDDKTALDFLSEKFKDFTNEIKGQLKEFKDDSHYMVPILNGLHGDSMEEKGHPALVNMSFRFDSRDISVEQIKDYLKLDENGGKLIIFVHGLMNDETIWQSSANDKVLWLGTFLKNQNKANILFVRYNTGRHISHNGRDLSKLIQQLYEYYHTEIKELNIIAHSMGGLVTRSAGYYAQKMEHSWLLLLKKVFLIGVPNEGSYLARVAHMTQYFMRKFDPTENDSLAKFFEIRSSGLKDLSFGFLVDEDWQNTNYENEKKHKAIKVYPVPNVEYYLIAATVSEQKEKRRIFTFFGDGLVEKQSALTSLFKENQIQEGLIHFMLFEDENHLSLLESEKVKDYVLDCLGWK